MKDNEPEEIIEDIEDVVVEVVKAPFKIANKLFGWMTGDDE